MVCRVEADTELELLQCGHGLFWRQMDVTSLQALPHHEVEGERQKARADVDFAAFRQPVERCSVAALCFWYAKAVLQSG